MSVNNDKKREIESSSTNDLNPEKKAKIDDSATKLSESNKEDQTDSNKNVNNEKESKKTEYKKQKIALLFGYIGTQYQGLQINVGAKTVEQTLFDAMKRCGIVDEDCESLRDTLWMRCARTDKGVHAVGNIVSFKANMINNFIKNLNSELPDDIRVFGFRPTTPGFHCKKFCEARTYQFVIPTFVFKVPTPMNDDDELFHSYRIDDETLKNFRKLMKSYEGSHNFHNYTIRKQLKDPSSQRVMKQISVEEPFVHNSMEFIVIRLLGQSFMMHQIRKMTGFAVMIIRRHLPHNVIAKTFKSPKLKLPLIPGVGLAIRHCWFTNYDNNRDRSKPQLTWVKEQPDLDDFMHKQIIPHVYELETGEWLKQQKEEFEDKKDTLTNNDDEEETLFSFKIAAKRPFAVWGRVLDKYEPDYLALMVHPLLQPKHAIATFKNNSKSIETIENVHFNWLYSQDIEYNVNKLKHRNRTANEKKSSEFDETKQLIGKDIGDGVNGIVLFDSRFGWSEEHEKYMFLYYSVKGFIGGNGLENISKINLKLIKLKDNSLLADLGTFSISNNTISIDKKFVDKKFSLVLDQTNNAIGNQLQLSFINNDGEEKVLCSTLIGFRNRQRVGHLKR